MWLDEKVKAGLERIFGTGTVLAVDIGHRYLTVAECSCDKGAAPRILSVGTMDIAPVACYDSLSTGMIISAIHKIVADNGMKSRRVLLTVPDSHVVARRITLPPVSPDKYIRIMEFETEQNIPFAMSEVAWDCHIQGGGEITSLMVAMKNDMLHPLVDRMRSAGYKTVSAEPSSTAVSNLLFASGYNKYCTMCIDIGVGSTTVMIVDSKYSHPWIRTIPVSGGTVTKSIAEAFECDMAEAEEMKKEFLKTDIMNLLPLSKDDVQGRVACAAKSVFTRLACEVARSVNFYKSQIGGLCPEKILLTGAASMTPGLKELINSTFNIKPERLEPFCHVLGTSASAEWNTPEHESISAPVAGIAVRAAGMGSMKINLLKRRKGRRKEYKESRDVCSFCPFHKK